MDLREHVALELDAARHRSLDLLSPLADDALLRQHSPLMSPLVWDLAHVGNYEEQWLLRALGGRAVRPDCDETYDAFRHARPERPGLSLLPPSEARRYIAEVRGRVLKLLDRVEIPSESTASPDQGLAVVDRERLLTQGYVYGMVIQHEHQHDETMLATLQLAAGAGGPEPGSLPPCVGRAPLTREVRVDGGTFVMGSDDAWAYDNERPAHPVEVNPYWIDTAPVTNADYLEFIEDGGYSDPRLWSGRGWEWRKEADLEHPQFWEADGAGSWSVHCFGSRRELPATAPVQHVCWYEADAFARWAGRRLPTEAEWEMAASWQPPGHKLRHPWGDRAPDPRIANLGQRHSAPAAVGAYPDGASPWGCHQMLGDVWEWTASDFLAYPGFRWFPYREYSEVFYGSEYKVLRGGSWATHPCVARTTFRNWDYPIRRQIFAGFRCARDDH
jgi:iron(II)-dependent oxidoreductase